MTDLVVVGAGGFGREVLDVAYACGLTDCVVVDDAPSADNIERLGRMGARHLGTIDDWLTADIRAPYLIGVGHPTTRSKIAQRIGGRASAATLVHPSATIGRATILGAGSVVCAGAALSNNVELGRHVHVNPNATIGHDTVLGDMVSVNPGAVVSGACTVDTGVLLGAGSVVLQDVVVGRFATVGAAACVVRDVPPRAVVKGVPAR
ncbi:NeuD/PglB/VioB family sugar acetyltransferase [Pseudactinotalea suaedae]|uniref:NeuD/PglB/VioB family sugar acetyltransferase n=1 Tax=Pseudactinotalea suaedae TaxID=1524924 RepID=UPI0012E2E72E|nr:NeuD/PglB/VioB family sugar acetyltransferase [Pseudactinotalea suaedae]